MIMIDRNFQINDFVLVKFNTKKTVVHYLGRIEDISHTMATIKFIRLSKIKNTFFPEVDDIASVSLDDIKTKLPGPKTCNKTKRGSSKYTFHKPLWVIPNLCCCKLLFKNTVTDIKYSIGHAQASHTVCPSLPAIGSIGHF